MTCSRNAPPKSRLSKSWPNGKGRGASVSKLKWFKRQSMATELQATKRARLVFIDPRAQRQEGEERTKRKLFSFQHLWQFYSSPACTFGSILFGCPRIPCKYSKASQWRMIHYHGFAEVKFRFFWVSRHQNRLLGNVRRN